VAVSQATLDRLKADRVQAVAMLEQATADHERATRLRPSGALSQEDADRTTAAWKTAQAGVARADAALIEGQKQMIAADRTFAYRKALLADTQIVAPFDGLIVQRHRDPGDIAVPGSAILTLVSTKELWITAWVDETAMSGVAVGQPARVVFRSEPEHAYRGEVARLGRQADRETREFPVDVRVLELPKNWAVGQRAEVYLETAHKTGVMLLPSQLILWREGKPGVFVGQGQRAAWRDLTLGIRGKDAVEVIAGLKAGENVVTAADGATANLGGRRIAMP
jgi:HlyD family secretion protein